MARLIRDYEGLVWTLFSGSFLLVDGYNQGYNIRDGVDFKGTGLTGVAIYGK